MTIALSLKVNDGVVLAADSATSLATQVPGGGTSIANVYNNANKVFNLAKGLPIGVITWGVGSIGPASIATIVKDLRRRLAGKEDDHHEWVLNRENYTVADVAETFRKYLYDELYEPEFSGWDAAQRPALGFIVAGYGSHQGMAEEYKIDIGPGGCDGPNLVRPVEETGASWSGQPEAISRLLVGYATALPQVLRDTLSLDANQLPGLMAAIQSKTAAPLIHPAMPIQDAIDFAEFLVHVSEMFARFMPAPPTVGGPIEVAAITKHEGFRWISRKHFYTSELNPGVAP